jgi:IclR family acetate operon transcriptional repressor
MAAHSADEKAGIGVVARAAAILRVLGEVPTGMSLGQIARRVGLARSTVQRLVGALESEGLIMTGTGAGTISLGPEFIRIARQSRPAIIDRVHPVMQEVSAAMEETVDFSMVQRRQIVFLDQVVGRQRLLAVSHVGDAFPLYCSSVGKAYLATLSPEEISSTIGDRYEARTPHTIRDLPKLLKALAPVRLSGIGFDEEEHSEGICAVGIAFEDGVGGWYGLSVPMPVGRFHDKQKKAVLLLKKLRTDIQDIIAGNPRATNLRAVS